MNQMEKMRRKIKGKKGFTLMEMLIVVAIIVVLLAIAIPAFNSALGKAKTAADEANVRSYYAELMVKNMDVTDATKLDLPKPDNVKEKMEAGGYVLQAKGAKVVPSGDTLETFKLTYTNESMKSGESFVVGGTGSNTQGGTGSNTQSS